MKFLLHWFLLVCLSALAGAAWVSHRPADLSAIGGWAEPWENSTGGKKRDAFDEMRQAAIKRTGILEITETELNRHLATALTARMTPSLQEWAQFERVLVDLEPDVAHLILSWQIRGHRRTATVDMKVLRMEQTFRIEVIGGHYGHLQMPRGLMRPLTPVLKSLSTAFEQEVQALFQMNQIQISKDKLVLDPRF